MSGYTSARLTCNGRIPGSGPGVPDRPCPERVEGGEHGGEQVYLATVADARKLARRLGWTFVRFPHVPSLSDDYCPACADQAEERAATYGGAVVKGSDR